MVDLSALDRVEIFGDTKIASVEGGCTQGQLDLACEPHRLATTAGHNATTGVGGLTLQGGHGYLERKFGLVVDNLVRAEVVTADGTLRVCDADLNPDLFWALRGGGGNFGIVTKFWFRLHELGSEIYAGLRVHVAASDNAFMKLLGLQSRAELIKLWCERMRAAPNDATGLLILPAGGPVVESLLWTGSDLDEGAKYFCEKHNFGSFRLKNSMKNEKYHSVVQKLSPVCCNKVKVC